MMSDLMDQHVGDDSAQRFVMLGPIKQDRNAKSQTMFGICVGALSDWNGRPTPWNRPNRSSSLWMPMWSSTSSVA